MAYVEIASFLQNKSSFPGAFPAVGQEYKTIPTLADRDSKKVFESANQTDHDRIVEEMSVYE
jgi:hypothetical protein